MSCGDDTVRMEMGEDLKGVSTGATPEHICIVPRGDLTFVHSNYKRKRLMYMVAGFAVVVACMGVVAIQSDQIIVVPDPTVSDEEPSDSNTVSFKMDQPVPVKTMAEKPSGASRYTYNMQGGTCSQAMSQSGSTGQLCFDDGEVNALVPTVFLLGSQKCATSSLMDQMMFSYPSYNVRSCGMALLQCALLGDDTMCAPVDHSQECQFFDRYENFAGTHDCSEYYDCAAELLPQSDPFYRQSGRYSCDNSYVMVDYSPNYLAAYDVVDRVTQMYGEHAQAIRFIMVFRDPTDRVISYFKHFQSTTDINDFVRLGLQEVLSHETRCDDIQLSINGVGNHPAVPDDLAVTEHAVNAICAGAYIVHLKRWVAAHTPSQFLLLSFTEYIAQPGRTLAAIGDHLGIASKEVQQELIANISEAEHANDSAFHLARADPGINFELSDFWRAELDKFYASYTGELLEFAEGRGDASAGIKTAFKDAAGKPVLY